MLTDEDNNVPISRRMVDAAFCNLTSRKRNVDEELSDGRNQRENLAQEPSANQQQRNDTNQNVVRNSNRANTEQYNNRKLFIMPKGTFVFLSAGIFMIILYIGVILNNILTTVNVKNFRYYVKSNASKQSFTDIFFEFNFSLILHHVYFLLKVACFAMATMIAGFLILTKKYRFILTGELNWTAFWINTLFACFIIVCFAPAIPKYPFHLFSLQNYTYCLIFVAVVIFATKAFVKRMREYHLLIWATNYQHIISERAGSQHSIVGEIGSSRTVPDVGGTTYVSPEELIRRT